MSIPSPKEVVKQCRLDYTYYDYAIKRAEQEILQQNYTLVNEFREQGYLDMALFSKFFFGARIFGPVPHFHQEFYDSYKSGYGEEFMVVMLPRGVGKTTVCNNMTSLHGLCYFNAYAWKYRDQPRMTGHPHIVLCSESKEAAIDFLKPIKFELETNELLKAAFAPIAADGPQKGQHSFVNRDNSWTGSKLELANGSMIRATGSGGQIRGRVATYHRPTLIVIDDPEGKKKVTDIDIIKSTRDWFYTEVMESRYKTSFYNGRLIVVGTAVHEHCLANHLRKNEPDTFKSIFYPILVDGDDGKQHSIWEDEKPTKQVIKERERAINAGRENLWLQENMNIPISKAEHPFGSEKFRYWKGEYFYDSYLDCNVLGVEYTVDAEGTRTQMGDPFPVHTYIGIDLASTETSKSDFSIVMVVALDYYDNIYVLDYWRKRTSIPTETRDKAIEYAIKYRIKQMCIETVAFQNSMLGLIKKKLQELVAVRKCHWFKIVGEKHRAQMDKTDRLSMMEVRFDQGQVYFKENSNLQMIKEFTEFPQGEHDDTVDGLWLAINRAKRCGTKTLPTMARRDAEARRRYSKPVYIDAMSAA